MLRFPRLIPHRFIPGGVSILRPGLHRQHETPVVVSRSRSLYDLPTITMDGMATAADIRRTIGNERGAVVIAISRNLTCRTSLFGVLVYRPYPPPTRNCSLYSIRRVGADSLLSNPHRPDLVALNWHQTQKSNTGAVTH